MASFDPELHLRLLGERGILNGVERSRGRDSPQADVALALIAIGAIDLEQATEIVEGYALAAGLRNGEGMARWRVQTGSNAPTTPEQRRTVLCQATLERPNEEILVRSVTLTKSETRLSVLIRSRSPGLGRRHPMGRGRPGGGMFSYPIRDDRGGKGTTSFGGGGSDTEWRGRLTSSQPLAVGSEWIELDGTRIDLVDTPSPSTVTIEPLENDDPVSNYVWRWLATVSQHGLHLDLAPVLDVLRLAGGLRFDDQQLAVIRQAAESRRFGRQSRSGPPPGRIDGVPEEWRSFLDPKPKHRGASGRVALAATAPPFDGLTVVADELTSDVDGWQVEVEISPGINFGPFGRSLSSLRVAWWAVDDRGQYYLGHMGSYSGGSDGAVGTLEFSPALDGDAKSLTLLPSGPTERARIEFPLDWSEQ
jgi:hypothetical protein